MANELKEINDIVKKCRILLLDIEGTTTSISFVKDKLFPYAEEKVKQFLETQWEQEDVKEAVTALRKLALEDKEKSVDGVVHIPGEDASKEDQIEGVVNNVKWQMSADRKVGPLKQLQGLIWKQGYDNGDIKGHVYDDVSPALEQWQSVEGQKVYIYSSGSVQAQKMLFGQSEAGDLLRFIEGHFDTAVGAKQEAGSYTAIAESIGCKPDEILFLTDVVKEAEAARAAGMHAALVSREGNAPLPAGAAAAFAVLHSLAQLASNKRKTEPQDELPAKIAKTDNEGNIKSIPDVEPVVSASVEKETKKSEEMEVEEEEKVIGSTKEVNEQKEADAASVVTETIVEEVTDEPMDVPVADVEPIVIEEMVENTEEKKTEQMETESTKSEPSTNESKGKEDTVDKKEKEKPKKAAPVAEETSPMVITEIEEVMNEKVLEEAEEIIDDIEPIVEEPPANEDIEVLQSAGEVLEKECDEILSKVEDVTNLDTMSVKPLLKPIAEETMEAGDSNDTVDRILDTEIEQMKQNEKSENVDTKNTEPEIKEEETKALTVDEKKSSEGATDKASEVSPEEKLAEQREEIKSEEIAKESEKDPEDSKAESIEDKITKETNKSEPESTEASVEVDVEQKISEKISDSDTKVPVESKENTVGVEVKPESESAESQMNGKRNRETVPVSLNGDASKDEELSSRLSAENGKQEELNGSNGDSVVTEKVQEDNKVEAEVSDIKVKTVPTEEPRTDPIEQPTEA
ncbi:unnamed protein product [Parnassius mnemosyne]|uniref:Enolase-phosphatase E1 n=1 Tax=Parnassius mnemosyne TaxID=213953 RepID=A0AAV1KMD2_9NEOP